jgi:multiple sugar transport system substrate-binding protein
MKSTKIASIVLAALFTTSVFAGCANKEEAKPGSSTSDTKPVTLRFMTWNSDHTINKPLLDQFMEENKNIKIEVIEGSDKEYSDKLTVSLAAGESIDLFATKNGLDFADMAYKNQCLALDNLISKDKYDLKPYGPIVESMKIDGKLYGLPYRKTAWALYYNKDLFDKAGVTYPKADMTWKEFIELSKKMTQGEGNDKIWGSFIHTWDAPLMMPALQRGKSVMDDDTAPLKESLELLEALYKDKSASDWGANKSTSAHYRAAFEKGNIAMVPMGEFLVSFLINDKKDGKHNVNWDITAMPRPEGVAPNTTWGTPTPISIAAKSSNTDAAWKFITYYAGEKGSLFRAKQGLLPAFMNAEVKKAFESTEGAPKGITYLSDATVLLESPIQKNVKAVTKIYNEEAELFLIGKNPIDTALKNFESRKKAELGK